ncbi:MAG: peptide deformylase [Planctomycetota bacterium]
MAIRKISIWPDPVLKEVATPVERFDDALKTLVEDMFDTMYEAHGVGLAGNQVAVPKRVLVIDLDPGGGDDPSWRESLTEWGFKAPTAFINPEIVKADGDIVWEEGCLSVPGVNESVKRKEHVVVRAQDVEGRSFDTEAWGLFAVALQHEMDHLDGKVFVEYLSKLKRDVIKRRMGRIKHQHTEDGVEAAQALAAGGL